MGVIDPMTEWPTREETIEWRQKTQDRLLQKIQRTIWDEVIKVWKILDAEWKWFQQDVSRITTPEWKKFTCLKESVMDQTLIRVEDIFITHFRLEQTDRYWPWLSQWMIIQDIKANNRQVYTINRNQNWSPDRDALWLTATIHKEYDHFPQDFWVADFSVGPINKLVDNESLYCSAKLMD